MTNIIEAQTLNHEGDQEMIKAFAYCRVSGLGQVQGSGFDRQLDTIEKYAKSAGYEIGQVFKEQISGTTDETDRPEFSAMVTSILSNGCRTIIVESLDRLAREYRIQESLLIYLASKGITLIAANTAENVTAAISEDPMRKALIQIQGIFAELDKSLLVRKLRKARDKKRKDTGRCEGPQPYGSLPGEEEILKRVRYMRRRSKGQAKPMTYQAIADTLNGEGIKTRQGKDWTAALIFNILKKK
jgi:DNA invertase Pin-like site-specific DNA recombinase